MFIHPARIARGLAVSLILLGSLLALPRLAVAAGPILGDDVVEPSPNPSGLGVAEANQFIAVSSGTVDTVSIYLDGSNAATRIALGIYADNNGAPGALLGQGTANASSGTWTSVAIPTLSLSAGGAYWLARLSLAGGDLVTRVDPAGSNPDRDDPRGHSTLPATFSPNGNWRVRTSIYASLSGSPAPSGTGAGSVGNSNVERDLDPSGVGTVEAMRFLASASGPVSAISIYLDATNGATNVALGIYADAGGAPGSLLTQGSVTSTTNGAWNTAAVPAVTVTAGSAYWIARLAVSGGHLVTRGDTTKTNPDVVDSRRLSSMPATFSPGASYPHLASLYAGAAPAGPSPTPTPTSTPAPTPTPTPAPTPGSGGQCMEIIGFSQTYQWYYGGGGNEFLSQMPAGGTQLRWQGGASIDAWADPSFMGWSAGIQSAACTVGSNNPDRVVITISGAFNSDVTWWHDQIAQAVANARRIYPGIRTMYLQPVVGGPNHGACYVGGNQVRATFNEPYIGQAIDRLVSEGVGVWGANPLVNSCSEYADDIGHLTDPGGRSDIATQVGSFYSRR